MMGKNEATPNGKSRATEKDNLPDDHPYNRYR